MYRPSIPNLLKHNNKWNVLKWLVKAVKMDAAWAVEAVERWICSGLRVFQAQRCYVTDNGSVLTTSSSHRAELSLNPSLPGLHYSTHRPPADDNCHFGPDALCTASILVRFISSSASVWSISVIFQRTHTQTWRPALPQGIVHRENMSSDVISVYLCGNIYINEV